MDKEWAVKGEKSEQRGQSGYLEEQLLRGVYNSLFVNRLIWHQASIPLKGRMHLIKSILLAIVLLTSALVAPLEGTYSTVASKLSGDPSFEII